jgi:hypothetical protein
MTLIDVICRGLSLASNSQHLTEQVMSSTALDNSA